jgi:hypothetical protein
MKRMYRFCFSCFFSVLLFFGVSAQEGRIKGIRIGYDLSRLALLYFEPERKAFEISGDFEVKQNFYAVAEYGQQKVDIENTDFIYASEGFYTRIGMDYNFSKTRMDVNRYEMVFGGIRYGFANYSHQSTNIVLPENYWGTESSGDLPAVDMNAHWVELVAGIRGELFKNFFIGWSFRGRIMIWQKDDELTYPYNIPGFGRGNKKAQMGFNYSVYYRIPLYKTKK